MRLRLAASLSSLVLGAAALGVLPGCSSRTNAGPSDPPKVSDGVDQAKSSLSRNTSPNVPDSDVQTLTSGERDFALRLYAQLKDQPANANQNVFFSPHSVHTALGMLYAGAQGATEAAMKTGLSYALPQAQLHPAFDALDLALESRTTDSPNGQGADGKGFRLAVTNSLWAQRGAPFESPYLDTLALDYGAGVNLLDFQADPQGATDTINEWVAAKTENRIEKLLATLSSDTKMVLVNAVYFNAAWQNQFVKAVTAAGTFHAPTGDISVSMMHNLVKVNAAQTADYDAIALPYEGGKVEFVAVAPKAGTFSTFESGFDRAKFDGVIAGFSTQKVQVTLPRFTVAPDTFSLDSELVALGMSSMYGQSADFRGITSMSGFGVNAVVHKAFIKVDEDGTEAAAATEVAGGSAIVDALRMTFDRPFLFAIRDVPTGDILFMGRVVAPAE